MGKDLQGRGKATRRRRDPRQDAREGAAGDRTKSALDRRYPRWHVRHRRAGRASLRGDNCRRRAEREAMRPGGSQQRSVYLPPALWAWIGVEATRRRMTRSGYINWVL